MKPRNFTPFRSHAYITAVFSVALFSHFAAPAALAATRFWDGGSIGGTGDGAATNASGTWSTTNANWDQGNGLPRVVWVNSQNDLALFNGGSNTITLGSDVTVGAITQAGGGSGIGINGGTGNFKITLGSTGSNTFQIFTGSTARSATISAEITGVSGNNLNFTGGFLNLSGVNTFLGNIAISGSSPSGVFTVNGAGSLGSGSYAGTISIASGCSLIYGSSASQTLSGVISGAGTLTKNTNSSTLTLTNTNTYSGTTSITAGTLALTGTGSINSSSGITINGSSAKLLKSSSPAVTPAVTLTNGTLTGSGTVNTVNVGNATGGIISNNNGVAGASLTVGALTFNGAATVNTFGNASAAIVTTALGTNAAGLVTINPTAVSWTTGSTYDLISYAGGSIGGGNFAQFALGTVTGKAGRQTATLVNTGTAVALQIGGTTDFPYWVGTTSSQWDTTTNNNWKLVTAGTDTNFIQTDQVLFDDNASGAGPVTVNIDTANVATTSTTFNNDTRDYLLNSTGGFGISAGNLIKNGNASVTLDTNNTYSGTTTINAGTLRIGAGGTSGTLGSGSVLNNSALVFNRSNAYQVDNLISGTGTVTNGGTAANVLDITANNTYSGGTFINGGGIRLRTDLGGRLGSGTVTVASGANFQIWAPSAVTLTNAIVLNGTTGVLGRPALNQDGGTGKVTLSGPITLNATSDIGIGGTSSNDMEISGQISGLGGLIIDEKGLTATNRVLTLSGANTYSGNTTLNGGILSLGNVSALQNTSAINMATGTTLRPIIVGPVTLTAPITTAGSVTVGAPTVANGGQAFNEFILNGAIGGTGNVTFNNTNNVNQIFTVTLGAANNYGGTTLLDNTAGTAGQIIVKLGVNNALPTTTVVTIDGQTGAGTGRYAEINLNGFNQTLAGLTNVTRSLRVQRIVNSDVSLPATLTINNTADSTFSGNLGSAANGSVSVNTIPGSTNGNNFSLTKSGTGTFTLSGVNSYTGATTVSGGTLALVGGSQSSPITVNNLASLGFTLGSPTTSNSAVTFNTGSTVTITGTPVPATTYTLLTTTATITGTPTLSPLVPGFDLQVDGTNTLKLVPAASGYANWQTANSTAQAANLDHDNDGVSNGIEYFLGGNTNTTGFTALPGVVNTGGTLTTTWTKAASYTGTYSTDFVVETSSTLTGVWGTAVLGAGPNQVVISGNNVTYTFPSSGAVNFARLRVTGP